MTTATVYTQYSPEELKTAINRYQDNDPDAALQLYQWFNPLVLSLACAHTGSNGESNLQLLEEDVINILWIKFYELLKNCKSKNFVTLPGYIKTCLENYIVDVLRSNTCRTSHEVYDEVAINAAYAQDTMEDLISDINLQYAMQFLTPLQSKVIYYLYFADYTLFQTKATLNISLSKIWYAHKTAKQILRMYYQEYEAIIW